MRGTLLFWLSFGAASAVTGLIWHILLRKVSVTYTGPAAAAITVSLGLLVVDVASGTSSGWSFVAMFFALPASFFLAWLTIEFVARRLWR